LLRCARWCSCWSSARWSWLKLRAQQDDAPCGLVPKLVDSPPLCVSASRADAVIASPQLRWLILGDEGSTDDALGHRRADLREALHAELVRSYARLFPNLRVPARDHPLVFRAVLGEPVLIEPRGERRLHRVISRLCEHICGIGVIEVHEPCFGVTAHLLD